MKLLSAGCSLVYGAELSDSPNWLGHDPPSKKTWPALYCADRNLEYHTCAVCGISNEGIARYVIDYVEKIHPDYVLVQWTLLNRYEVRFASCNLDNSDSYYYSINFYQSTDVPSDERSGRINPNLPTVLEQLSTFWYRHIDSDLGQLYHYLKNKIYLSNYLRYKNIPFVFVDSERPFYDLVKSTADPSINTLYKLHHDIPTIDFEGRGFYDWAVEKGYPIATGGHPLDPAHQAACDIAKTSIDSHLKIVQL